MALHRASYLCLLLFLAFAVRWGAVTALRDIREAPYGIESADDVQFHRLATNLASGDGYVLKTGEPTSFRAPGFPFFLAALYAVTGQHVVVAYVAFCALGALNCLLTYLLAREFVDEPWAQLAGLLSVFYLGHIYFSTVFMSEVVFAPLVTFGVWVFVRYIRSGGYLRLVAASVAIGLASLTRPYALLLVPLLMLVLTIRGRSRAVPRLVELVLLPALVVAVLLPWWIRNYHVHGRFVLVATNGGSTFYGANNDTVVTEPRLFGYWVTTVDLPYRDLIEAQPDEVSQDKMEWKLGIDWLRAHPEKIPQMTVYKLGRLLIWPSDFDEGFKILRSISYAPYLLLMLLGAAYCATHRECWSPEWLVVHGSIIATLITAVIFWGCARFRDVNLSMLMLYCVYGFAWLKYVAVARSPSERTVLPG